MEYLFPILMILKYIYIFSSTQYRFQLKVYIIDFFRNILVPPRIVPFSFDEPIFSGQSAQITCLVSEGDTPLNISWWFHESDELPLSPLPNGISVNKMGNKLSMLFIENTSSYFAGHYVCLVENRAGRSKYTASLNVHGNPLHVSCKHWLFTCFKIKGL